DFGRSHAGQGRAEALQQRMDSRSDGAGLTGAFGPMKFTWFGLAEAYRASHDYIFAVSRLVAGWQAAKDERGMGSCREFIEHAGSSGEPENTGVCLGLLLEGFEVPLQRRPCGVEQAVAVGGPDTTF